MSFDKQAEWSDADLIRFYTKFNDPNDDGIGADTRMHLRALRAALEASSRQEERLSGASESIQWIIDHCAKLRMGTDDWFELVEIAAFARKALEALEPPHAKDAADV